MAYVFNRHGIYFPPSAASGQDLTVYEKIPAKEYRLQPCATGNADADRRITKETIDYILEHPLWRLSLQTHKMVGIM